MDCRKLEFTIAGQVDTTVSVEEGDFDGDGFTDLKFTLLADPAPGQIADLRGLFWDVTDESQLGNMSVWAPGSADVTDSQFTANSVVDLGGGANMSGSITAGGKRFDAGVEIGTQGIGADDIQSTEFVIRVDGENLDLDAIGGVRFGVRYTSVGNVGGNRADSLKIAGNAPFAPDAIDDALTTDEDTAAAINILANDTDGDNDPLTVIEVEGGTVGAQFTVTTDDGRDALVTVNANGTFSVDPDDNFEDLSTGETDTFDLEYTISDGDGGEDCATVTVTIEGVNDAPVANDDFFFVEFADTALVDVAANDTDVDGTVDPSTLAFNGADLGTATEDGGLLRYLANVIPYDTIDSSANDPMTYTVDDNEGATSNAATVTAKVIDPLRESDIHSANAANGQLISLSLETEDRTFNTSSFVEVDITTGALDQNVNVSFVIDGSGSVGAANYDQERLAVQNAINDLRADYAGSAATVTVQLVQFSSGASGASFDLFSSALNNIAVGTPVSIYQNGGSTNYEAALDQAVSFFTGKAADDNFLLFASDGAPNAGGPFTDEVTELQSLNVSRTAVGFGGAVQIGPLNQIDNTGGAQIVPNAAALGDVFADSPLFPADLFSFSLTVNGVEVADELDLIPLGGGDFSFDSSLISLDNTLGATNEVVATAEFDTNNDGIADETRMAETVINGTDGSDILFV